MFWLIATLILVIFNFFTPNLEFFKDNEHEQTKKILIQKTKTPSHKKNNEEEKTKVDINKSKSKTHSAINTTVKKCSKANHDKNKPMEDQCLTFCLKNFEILCDEEIESDEKLKKKFLEIKNYINTIPSLTKEAKIGVIKISKNKKNCIDTKTDSNYTVIINIITSEKYKKASRENKTTKAGFAQTKTMPLSSFNSFIKTLKNKKTVKIKKSKKSFTLSLK